MQYIRSSFCSHMFVLYAKKSKLKKPSEQGFFPVVYISWTFHTQMFVPVWCWVAPVTRWLPDLHNLSFFTFCNLERRFSFFSPWISRKKEGSGFHIFVLERGSQNLECTGRKSQKQGYLCSLPSFTSLLLCFYTPSPCDKEGKGMMEQWISRAPGWGSVHVSAHVCVHVCCGRVKRFRGGGLPSRAVFHHTVDPPGSFRCPSGFIILLSS